MKCRQTKGLVGTFPLLKIFSAILKQPSKALLYEKESPVFAERFNSILQLFLAKITNRIKPLNSKKSTLHQLTEEPSHKMYPLLNIVYHGLVPYATIKLES